MLKRVEERLAKELVEQAAEIKARQTAQHEHIAMEAMEAWEKSKEDGVTVKSNEKEKGVQGGELSEAERAELLDDFDPEAIPFLYYDQDNNDTSSEERAQKIAEATAAHISAKLKARGTVAVERTKTEERRYQCGDPRFLDQAQKALASIRDIWGLDAPKKQEHSGGISVTAVTGYDILPPNGTGDTSTERQN